MIINVGKKINSGLCFRITSANEIFITIVVFLIEMDEYQVNSIALKTLKQRCEYLQWRLNAVEEENCKLKLGKGQDTKTAKGFDNLEERIVILNKEKSQMAHEIQLITNENSALWEQLSKFSPERNISSLKFSVSAAPNSQVISQYESTSNDYSKESLEEISLKLINGIIMGKNELEKQYSQMVDLQRENDGHIDKSSFTHRQIDNRAAAKNIKDYVQKLKDFKQILFKQKNDLSSAIMLIKNSPVVSQSINTNNREISNFNHVSSYRESNINVNQPTSEFSTLQDPGRLGNGDLNMICPMCYIHFNGSFEKFSAHVSGHFCDDNDEFVDAIANFES